MQEHCGICQNIHFCGDLFSQIFIPRKTYLLAKKNWFTIVLELFCVN